MKIKIHHHLMNNIQITRNNVLFYISLVLFQYYLIFGSSLIDYNLPRFIPTGIKVVVTLLLLLELVTERYSWKRLIVTIFIIAITVLMSFKTGYRDVVVIVLMIMAAKNSDFEDILKITFINCVIGALVVISLNIIGVLPDYIYTHTMGSSIRIAHSLGFKYYSTLGYLAMTTTIIHLYENRKLGYFHLAGIIVFNYLLYCIHTTNLALYISVAAVVGYIGIIKLEIEKFTKRFWLLFATVFPSLIFMATVMLIYYFYRINAVTIQLAPFFGTVMSRIRYSVQAFQEYGISLFGHAVTMYGGTAYVYGDAPSGFFIDSGYIFVLIAYGILFSVTLIFINTILFRYIWKRRDPYLYFWFILLLVINVFNDFTLSLLHTPMLFLLPTALAVFQKNKLAKGYGSE